MNGKYDSTLSIGEQIKTRHYKGSAESFGKNQLLDEMLECIEDEDVDRMMELFSDYAQEENDVLDEELEKLFDDFPEIDEVRNNSCAAFRSDNIGTTEYRYMYQRFESAHDHQ